MPLVKQNPETVTRSGAIVLPTIMCTKHRKQKDFRRWLRGWREFRIPNSEFRICLVVLSADVAGAACA